VPASSTNNGSPATQALPMFAADPRQNAVIVRDYAANMAGYRNKISLGLLREGKAITVNLELQQSSQSQVDSSTIFSGIEGAEMS
ncbi:hypothetical protein MJM25_29545, partial [Salmonella enterica subsp. enterica serovar Lubbock]|nr:hypothetical protein [Salmonella enterica subsp. enterica serovar Lubbock]